MSIFVGIGFLYAYKYTKSLLHSKYFQKLKNKIWPKSDYLDFNIFFTSYKLPSVHVYDENLKFEIQNTNCCLSEVIENTITGKSPDLLTIIKPKTGLKYGILYKPMLFIKKA